MMLSRYEQAVADGVVVPLGDGRIMLCLTHDQARLLSLITRVKKDPPWEWSSDEINRAHSRLEAFENNKKPERIVDFLKHYGIDEMCPKISYLGQSGAVVESPTPIQKLLELLFACLTPGMEDKRILLALK